LGILVFLITAYAAGGFFLAPSWLTRYLSESLQQTADMGLTAGEARFNPFTLRLQLLDIVSTDSAQTPAPTDTLLQIDHLLIDLNLIALLRNGLASNRLEIQGLTLTLIRYPDKSYNLPALASADNSRGKEDPLSLSRPPLLFSVNNISIRNSRMLFDDRVAGKKHSVEQLKLDLPSLSNFSFVAREYIRPHFSAVINGSPVELSGEAAMPGKGGANGLKTNLSCNVQDLDLPLYFSYLPSSVPLVLSQGKGNGRLQISFIPKDQQGGLLTIGFALTTTGVELANREQTLSMTAPTLAIEGSLQPLDGALRIQNLHALQPQFSADKANFSRDMAQLFSSPTASPETPGQQQPRPHLEIDSLTVEDGTLRIINSKKESPDQPPWNSIQLTVKNFRLAPEPAGDKGTFALSTKQEKTQASIDWQGSFNNRGIPGGALLLNNIEARTLLAVIDPSLAADTSGSANLSGHFSFDPTVPNSGMTTLIDATTEILDLILLDQKKPWLSARKVATKDTKFKEDKLDLGTITLEEGTLTLQQNKLPHVLQGFRDDRKRIQIQGLGFSGKATLNPQQDKAKVLQIDELQIKAGKLMAGTDSQNNFDLTARINQTGRLKGQGLTTLAPLQARLSLVFSAISSEQVAPWLPEAPLFQYSRAIVHGQGTYRYPEASFTGDLQLDSALIRGNEKGSGLAASKAEIKNIAIKTNPLGISIQELVLDTPNLSWLQDSASPDPLTQIGAFLQGLVASSPDKGKQPKDDGRSSSPVIRKIRFDNGTISYTDQRLNPPWSAEISQLNGQINTVPEKSAAGSSFDLAGQISSVPFTLSGSADLLTSEGDFTSDLVLKGFPLQLLSEQISPLLDLNPDSASLDLTVKHNRQAGEEQGEANLLFTGLRPGSVQADTALPLALIADSRDQIQLLIPLPADSVQPLFTQTVAILQTMRAKAAVAPFLLAGAEFADLRNNQFISFPAGLSELDEIGNSDARKNLQQFAALLAARPHLGLILTGVADPIHDRAVIQQALEEQESKRVALKNKQRLEEWLKEQKIKKQAQQAQQTAAPQGKITERDIPPQDTPPVALSPDPITVSDTTLLDLARERALHIYDFYAALPGIASRRISIQEQSKVSETGTPGNQVLIELQYVEQAEQ